MQKEDNDGNRSTQPRICVALFLSFLLLLSLEFLSYFEFRVLPRQPLPFLSFSSFAFFGISFGFRISDFEFCMVVPDPWTSLRRHTPARIALGRAGGSLPTGELLDFAKAHAAARDAVWSELDLEALEQAVRPTGLAVVKLQTSVPDRRAYLLRPDLGRRLHEASRQSLQAIDSTRPADVAIIIADGLSAMAAQIQAPAVVGVLVRSLESSHLHLAPLSLVRFGRVAVQDEIGSLLGARLALILLGERPGLGTADSLGAYLVNAPGPGRTDADRNCVSNIRPSGLPPASAAETLHYLIAESLRKQISGVALKDGRAFSQAKLPTEQ
jgi:ethanolamine ammonia-lyase small subunit